MFDVVTCGFPPAALRAHPGAESIQVLPWPDRPSFLEAGYDALASRPGQPVVLLHDSSASSTRRVATLRAAVRSKDLLSVRLNSPLTGLAGAAALLSSLAGASVPAGLAVGYLLERHRSLLPTYAVVASVANLDLPMVKLSHHLVSWVPGTMFSVAVDSEPQLTTGRLDVQLPVADATDLVVCGSARYAERLHAVTPAQVGERFELALPVEGPLWWGRAKFYEQTLVPRNIQDAVSQIRGHASAKCAVCGESAFTSCPYCKMREGQAA